MLRDRVSWWLYCVVELEATVGTPGLSTRARIRAATNTLTRRGAVAREAPTLFFKDKVRRGCVPMARRERDGLPRGTLARERWKRYWFGKGFNAEQPS
jgi:hypothetical protein